MILIASGWHGVLKVGEEFKKEIEDKEIELKVVLTGRMAKEYQNLTKQGKKVNALIHTTC
ncbi:hypothetical protein FJZ41_03020 [Candidatus Shapirobacteria bacterium]|nr:hypothetical protein [Candidatus Shapirobacteria bacterium]